MQSPLSYLVFGGNRIEQNDVSYVTRAQKPYPSPSIDLRNLRHVNVGKVHILIIYKYSKHLVKIVHDIY